MPHKKHRAHRHPSHPHFQLDPDPVVVNAVISIGRRRKLSDDYILAALMVGLQESRLNNLNRGTGSSLGWRQETAGSYGSAANRLNVPASVERFYTELSHKTRGKLTLGHWGQAVQKSAYPDEYDKHYDEAVEILNRYDKKDK